MTQFIALPEVNTVYEGLMFRNEALLGFSDCIFSDLRTVLSHNYTFVYVSHFALY